MAKKTPSDALKEVTAAMDRGFAKFITNTQSKLSASAPRRTGRLASSWFVGSNSPNRKVEPPRDAPGPVTVEPYPGRIKMDGTWYISSNLPYSEIAALDPGYIGQRGGSGRGQWYTSIVDNMPADLDRIMQRELRKGS